ncbi:MAG: hypothetical protein JNL82_34260 [Myxococcales bacterium]|nr:hypothetical protein [Myxococcales bacterium]
MEALFKQYFWVVKGLGLAITAALAASVVTTYVGSSYIYDESSDTTGTGGETDTEGEEEEDDDEEKPVIAASLGGAGAGRSAGPSPAERNKTVQSIVGRNLFCPTCAKAVVDPGAPLTSAPAFTGTDELGALAGGPQPGEVPSTLPYRLVATMESSDPKFSWATLRDEETGGAGPYWPGDQIRPGARLISVERRMVHVRNGSALEYIELGVEPPKGAAKPVVDPNAKKADEKPAAGGIEGGADAIKCESEHVCTIERAWLEGILANPASLAKQARVMPSVKDGETRGFKFYGIRPGSLPKLLNLKNGDLVTAVNGIELKSMDGAMTLYTKLRRASNLQITVERKGETINKEITIQ